MKRKGIARMYGEFYTVHVYEFSKSGKYARVRMYWWPWSVWIHAENVEIQ